jgi:hypothetical protein
MSGRARGWGVPYVQGLLRNEQRATKRYWPWALPRIPPFLPQPTAVDRCRPLTHLTIPIRNINTFSTHQTLHIHRHSQRRCRHCTQLCS